MILKVRHLVEVQEAAQQKGRPRAEKAHDNLHEKKREIASEP
jgi:hypothetical protein